jgi:hypothetical protein
MRVKEVGPMLEQEVERVDQLGMKMKVMRDCNMKMNRMTSLDRQSDRVIQEVSR